ncbi:MAG: hypothetical protein ACI4ET_15060, partial [Bilifractor sp.]
GGLFFYVIWEGKPVYSYPFTFCMIIPAICGWEIVQDGCMNRLALPERQENALIQLIMTCIVLVAVASTFGRGLYIANGDAFSMPSIICDSKALTQWDSLAVGERMTQDFYPAYRFNHLRIAAEQVEEGAGSYRVTLDSEGKRLMNLEVTRSDIYNGYLTLYFTDIIPQKGQKFTLTISNENSLNNTIEWGSRLCYITSEYKGVRTLNGTEQAGDMLIRVYQFDGKS